jgi:PAS domain S-box-containing protein
MLSDGQVHWLAGRGELKRDRAGEPLRFIGVNFDVTERKQTEMALRTSEARLRAIVSAVPDVLLVLDEDGCYVEILTAQRHLLYTDPAALKGKRMSEVLPAMVVQQALDAIRQTLRSHEPQSFEYELSIARVGKRVFEARTAPLDAPFTTKPAVVLLARDITIHRLTEQSLRQAQKMEAVGQLTGGVAHDLLAIILGNLELLAETLAQPNLLDLVQRALDAVERGTALVHHLLAFGRRQPLQAKPASKPEHGGSQDERFAAARLGRDHPAGDHSGRGPVLDNDRPQRV